MPALYFASNAPEGVLLSKVQRAYKYLTETAKLVKIELYTTKSKQKTLKMGRGPFDKYVTLKKDFFQPLCHAS